MTPLGFSLIRKSDGAILTSWDVIPERVNIPSSGDCVFGASVGWNNDKYQIVERLLDQAAPEGKVAVSETRALVSGKVIVTRTYADPPAPPTPQEAIERLCQQSGFTLDDLKKALA